MRIQLLFLSLVVLTLRTHGQNLIPNGDFELGPPATSGGWEFEIDSNCNGIGPMPGADMWFVVRPTPDRLYEGDIPCNWDDDTAYSGAAYVNLGSGPGNAEAVGVNLQAGLEKDSVYHLTCLVSRQSYRGLYSHPARVAWIFTGGDSIVSSPILSTSWQLFDTTFVASLSATSLTIRAVEQGQGTGVKIDNVILNVVDGLNSAEPSGFPSLLVYPNPASVYFEIAMVQWPISIRVFNSVGAELPARFQNHTSGRLRVDVRAWPAGVYFITLADNKHYHNESIVVTR
jgi:hypothetical protein